MNHEFCKLPRDCPGERRVNQVRRGTEGLMITDRDIAQLCLDIYAGAGQWDQADLPADGIAFGVKDLGSVIALIFRGTASLNDFVHDGRSA